MSRVGNDRGGGNLTRGGEAGGEVRWESAGGGEDAGGGPPRPITRSVQNLHINVRSPVRGTSKHVHHLKVVTGQGHERPL